MELRRKRVVICGAAGRDFHNFNMVYRDRPEWEVRAFTATQIPGIDSRRYPAALAGGLYPEGIPIIAETELESLIKDEAVEEVVFGYSDMSHAQVMELGCRAVAAGANFTLLGPDATMLKSKLPVVSVCAVRTGCGKSQVTRFLAREMRSRGIQTAVIRHPMPYGNLTRQAVQRFASLEDLSAADCTLEEREEYEPHIANGSIVYAGVDYQQILALVESAAADSAAADKQEAQLILWDGGNNDFSFIRPDFSIVLVDALRPEQLSTHYPGAAVLRMADLVVVNKVHSATAAQLSRIEAGLDALVPDKPRVLGASPVALDNPQQLEGARVLIVEDGPTITHGGMPHGAGYAAVQAQGGAQIVDPRQSASAGIAAVYARYPHIGPVLPAMGYSAANLADLAGTINAADIDLVVAGTPIDLAGALELSVPVVRVRYDYQDVTKPGLMSAIDGFLNARGL